jgi:ABC-2 type transport system permease protein
MTRSATGRVNLGGVIRSEWRKLFSLRSTWILSLIGAAIILIFAAVMPLIIGLVSGTGNTGIDEAHVPDSITAQFAATGLMIGGLLWASAVIVSVAGEYSSHSVVSTLSAVPTRWPAYVAKALVTGVVGFVVGFLVHLISTAIVVGVFAVFGFNADFGGAGTFGEGLISGVYILVLTWMAVGLAALMRSTAGAIVVLAIFVYLVTSVLQGFAAFVHQDWLTWLNNHLPTSAVDALRPSTASFSDDLGAGAPSGVLAAWDAWLTVGFWALVPLVLGAWAFQRRGVR